LLCPNILIFLRRERKMDFKCSECGEIVSVTKEIVENRKCNIFTCSNCGRVRIVFIDQKNKEKK